MAFKLVQKGLKSIIELLITIEKKSRVFVSFNS